MAYGVNSDGSLSAAPNSPYTSATNNYVVTNGSNLYTIDKSGTQLEVYSIKQADGSLTLANTTNVIAGNTSNPQDIAGGLALDHTGSSLYVEEYDSSGDDGQDVWTVGSSPAVTQIQWVGPGENFGPPLVFSPDNKFSYTGNCYQATWDVFGYTRASNGTLGPFNRPTGAEAPPVMTANEQPCPAAFAVSANGFLAIAYTAQPQGGAYLIGTYKINSDGSLTPVANSLATTASNQTSSGTGSISINFDPTGAYLAAAGNGGVQVFTLSSTGLLSAVGAPMDGGTDFQNVAWDKSNHVFATTSSQVYVWNSTKGVLAPATGSPYGGGAGLAVLPLQ